MISLAPSSRRKSRLRAEAVAMTCAPACRAVDQDGLRHNQACVIKEGLPGRQICQRNGGGLHKVERAWFGDKLIGEGKSKFCLGPIATIAEHGIDLGAFDKRSDPRTYLLYHS